MLLLDCKQRLLAFNLEKAYEKCKANKEILAFSHRKVGWSAPKYSLNENFSIELKSNFGYGSVSYFYTKIRYKNLDIIPFSDWVNYQYSKIYEIVQYSSKHWPANESWKEAMEYLSEACNISEKNENKFIKTYIIDQCDEMIIGLKNILTNNDFKIKKYSFLNQEKGYINLKLKEHNLTEFRGKKISGALEFIKPLSEFANIIEIKDYIAQIEACNIEIKPMLIEEKANLNVLIRQLKREKNTLEYQLKRLELQDTRYDEKRAIFRQNLYSTIGKVSNNEFIEKFNQANPNYKKFCIDLQEAGQKFQAKLLELTNAENVLENIEKYIKTIVDYFTEKED